MKTLMFLIKKIISVIDGFLEKIMEPDRRCQNCRYYVPFNESMRSDNDLYDFHCAIEQDLFVRYSSENSYLYKWENDVMDWGWFLAKNCEEFTQL